MQNAPSVTFPVGRSASHTSVRIGLGALSGVALAVAFGTSWIASPAPLSWLRWTPGLALWLAWLAADGWRGKHQPKGMLKWDAQATPLRLEAPPGAWLWLAHGHDLRPETVRPEAVFDGQSRLLLRLHGGAWPWGQWVWLERATDPARWDDLRRALVASR